MPLDKRCLLYHSTDPPRIAPSGNPKSGPRELEFFPPVVPPGNWIFEFRELIRELDFLRDLSSRMPVLPSSRKPVRRRNGGVQNPVRGEQFFGPKVGASPLHFCVFPKIFYLTPLLFFLSLLVSLMGVNAQFSLSSLQLCSVFRIFG